jgi:NAD(P)-dependent dehydrogenase (short-subunit alcohol dehydrogenase family)
MEEANYMSLPVPDISRNLFDLSGYRSIVTGAGQGIGLVLAGALAYAGSDLDDQVIPCYPKRLNDQRQQAYTDYQRDLLDPTDWRGQR